MYGVLAATIAFTLFILACADEATATPTATSAPGPAATSTPTATAGPTATARPVATPTATAVVVRELVQPQLRVAIPTPSFQVTMQHPMNQIAARIIPMYDYLVGHDPKTNEEQPQLATEWTIGADGKSYNWKLRENIPFYRDGRATDIIFSARDVIHSWGITAGVKSERTLSVRPEFGGKVDADIVNDHEINLRLAVISLDMPGLLSDEWAVGISSVDYWDAVGEDGYLTTP